MSDTSSDPEKNQHSLKAWRDDLCIGVVFLTRLPLRLSPDTLNTPLIRAMRAFPLIGFGLGVIAALSGLALDALGFSQMMVATAMVLILVLLSGALHEDGLADVVDGFYGSPDRDRKLEIMRDSRLGTYGTLALIFTIALKIAALSSFETVGSACLALIAAASLSRIAPLVMVARLNPARTQGLASELKAPDPSTLWQGGALAVALFWMNVPFWAGLFVIALCAGVLYRFIENCRHHIGGQTGDTCGAAQQYVELSALLGLAALI